MDRFDTSRDELQVGGLPLSMLAERVGQTPFYAYDRALIAARIHAVRQVLPQGVHLHYAIKGTRHSPRIHRHIRPTPAFAMNLTEQVLHVLDGALRLQGRAAGFTRETALLGALPELDSMAVLALLTGLENHFGITFSDDDLSGSVFATVGSLSDLVGLALARQNT